MKEGWNVVWSQGKQKLHKLSHSALSPSPRRRNWVAGSGETMMLGVKTVCETHLTAGKRGVERLRGGEAAKL